MVKSNVRKSKRSGMMECPVCDRELPLVEHHIHGREVPRWREAWNVAWTCGACHDLIHQGSLILLGWYNVNGVRELLFRYKDEDRVEDFPDIEPPRYE